MKDLYLPVELQKLIQDFARPVTRVLWKEGSAFNNTLRPWCSRREKISSYRDFKNYLHQSAYMRHYMILNNCIYYPMYKYYRHKAAEYEFSTNVCYCMYSDVTISYQYVDYCMEQNYKCQGCNQIPCKSIQEQYKRYHPRERRVKML
jgi:hypothetical protein